MSDKPHLVPCRHRGPEFYPGHWICHSDRVVAPKGVTVDLCSRQCPYVDSAASDRLPKPVRVHGQGYGVAIGTYDSLHARGCRLGTQSVELNLAVLRANCGQDLRILVCDDGSPAASQRRYRELCRAYDAEFTTNRRRMGHTSGDMIVFHKAIRWARELDLSTVTKLSHRMMVDVPRWVQLDSEALLESGYATQTQILANFGLEQVRTECVMMVVDRWHTSNVLEHYRPRQIPYWNELHTFRAIAQYVDPQSPYPHFLPWQRLSYYRGGDRPPVFFREMQAADHEFQTLARRHGIALTDQFSTIDSCDTLRYQ